MAKLNWNLKVALVDRFGSQIEAAKQLGIRENKLSYIVPGHATPSEQERTALEKGLGRDVVRKLLGWLPTSILNVSVRKWKGHLERLKGANFSGKTQTLILEVFTMPVSMTRSMKNTLSFFKRLFGKTNGLIEIRCLPSKERIFNRDLKKLITFIQDNMDQNVYFGAATRKGKGGSKNYALEIPALWVDIDWKDFKRGKAEAMRLLKRFPLKPSIVVFTGHGMHVYWILQKPEKATSEIEGYLKGLALELKGDLSATELARILRVPGTINHKNGERISVTYEKDNGRRYKLKDFNQWWVETEKAEKQPINFNYTLTQVDVHQLGIGRHMKELILTGWSGSPYKSRSEADQAVITALVRVGATNDQIRTIFQVYPIGNKYRGKPGAEGNQYLTHSISSAKAFLVNDAHKSPSLKDAESKQAVSRKPYYRRRMKIKAT